MIKVGDLTIYFPLYDELNSWMESVDVLVKFSISHFFYNTMVSSTYRPQNPGGIGYDVRALRSKSSINIFAVNWKTGEPIAAPSYWLFNSPTILKVCGGK